MTMSKMIERTSLPRPEVMPKWLGSVNVTLHYNDNTSVNTDFVKELACLVDNTHKDVVKEFSFNIEQVYEKHPEYRDEIDAVLMPEGTSLGEKFMVTLARYGALKKVKTPTTEKQTAETLAPLLWNAYKDILNEEALAALRDVIENQDWKEIEFEDCTTVESAFYWAETKQGDSYWVDVVGGKYNKKVAQENIVENVSDTIQPQKIKSTGVSSKIKSTGGSSDYYKLTIHTASGETFQCEVGDVIQAMVGDNFQLGNVLKASRRMWLDSQGGGKDGIDTNYDCAKIHYFTNDFVQRYGKKNET